MRPHGHHCPACLGVQLAVETSWPAPPPQYCVCWRCGCAILHDAADEADATPLALRNFRREWAR